MVIKRFNGTIDGLIQINRIGTKIYFYGAGDAGVITYRLLSICGVQIDGFIDNSDDKIGTFIIDDVRCFAPRDIQNKDNCVVFICINWCNYENLYKRAVNDGFRSFCELSDVIDDVLLNHRCFLQDFVKCCGDYPINVDIICPGSIERQKTLLGTAGAIARTGRIAIYTASFGGYDEVHEPQFIRDDLDYYYISDDKPQGLSVFRWIDAQDIVPSDIESPILRNRYVKMHPRDIFPTYETTIYMDANLEIIDDVTDIIRDSKTGISVHTHYNRDCIYYEAIQLANYKRIPWQDSYHQIIKLLEKGFPIHYGLGEMPVIAVDHTKPGADIIMEEWWREFKRGAMRDQLSFMYVLWRLGYKATDIVSIGEEYRQSDRFVLHEHNYISKMVSVIDR